MNVEGPLLHAHRYYDVPPRLRNVIKDVGWHRAAAGPVVLKQTISIKISRSAIIADFDASKRFQASADGRSYPAIFSDQDSF